MKTLTRLCAAAAVGGVAVASLTLAPATASTKTTTHHTTSHAESAAAWLASELGGKSHDHYSETYQGTTYADYGDTADAVLSMDAAGVAQDAAKRATTYLEKNAAGYDGDGSQYPSPGPAGKLLLVAEAQHVPIRDFGGEDLVQLITATEGQGTASPGEYQQNGTSTSVGDEPNEYFVTISQSLAMLGLADGSDSGAQPDAAAGDFLAAQQCSDGGYPTYLAPTAGYATAAAACTAEGDDIDSTAYAFQALLAAGQHAAAHKAIEWLVGQEHSNGGFGLKTSNANSTAIAIEALIDSHRSIAKPRAWLANQQLGCGAKSSERGAVKFQKTYDKTSAIKATAQSGVALAGLPLAWVDKDGAHGYAPTLSC